MDHKKDKPVYEIGAPQWMVSFGDLMSLLLAFFVLILSFSSTDSGKLMNVIGGIQGALGFIPPIVEPVNGSKNPYKPTPNGTGGRIEGGVKEPRPVRLEDASAANLRSTKLIGQFNRVKERIEEIGFKHLVTASQVEQGMMMRFKTDSLFREGSETPGTATKKLLQDFGELSASLNNEIRIVAAFRQPESGEKFMNDWKLAGKRAFAVGDLMVTQFKLPAERFSYGMRILGKDEEESLEVILMEKAGTSKVNLEDFINKKM